MTRCAIAIVLALLPMVTPASAHVGSHEITVRDSYFDPQELHIDVGEAVTWNALHAGHTITADDGRFDFPGSRQTRQGDRFEWTFSEDETFYFHCKVHRGFMFGVVVVGAGSPPKEPSADPPEIRSVPGEHATIRAAMAAAPDGTIIEIAPGIYREPLVIDVPGLTLRGTGSTPAGVILDGMSQNGIGIAIAAPDVTIENMTVRRHTFAGIFASRARRFTVDRVVMDENDRYGLRAVEVAGGTIRDTRASTSLRAGFSIEGCVTCDVLLDRVLAEDNLAGVAAINAGGLVIRDSTFRDNGTGVALTSFPGTEGMPQRGAHVYRNLIEDNVRTPRTRPAVTDSFEIPSGAGVWVSGGSEDVVQNNVIRGHVYNVAVTGFTGPSFANRIAGNVLSGARDADLAWDGMGANVCFERNTHPDGSPASSAPTRIEALYACALPGTVGVPYPLVLTTILLHAAR